MRKAPLVCAAALPPLFVLLASSVIQGQAGPERARTKPDTTVLDPHVSFMRIDSMSQAWSRSGSTARLSVATDLWLGASYKNNADRRQADLVVEVFLPEDREADPFEVKKVRLRVQPGERRKDTSAFTIRLPLPPDPRGYPVRVTILGPKPKVKHYKDGSVVTEPDVRARNYTTLIPR